MFSTSNYTLWNKKYLKIDWHSNRKDPKLVANSWIFECINNEASYLGKYWTFKVFFTLWNKLIWTTVQRMYSYSIFLHKLKLMTTLLNLCPTQHIYLYVTNEFTLVNFSYSSWIQVSVTTISDKANDNVALHKTNPPPLSKNTWYYPQSLLLALYIWTKSETINIQKVHIQVTMR